MTDLEKLGAYIDSLRECAHYMLKQSVKVAMLYDKFYDDLTKEEKDYVDASIHQDSVS